MLVLSKTLITVESQRALWVKRLAEANTTETRNNILEMIAFCDKLLVSLAGESDNQPDHSSKSDG